VIIAKKKTQQETRTRKNGKLMKII